MIFQNKNYRIDIADEKYKIVNKVTEVVEQDTTMLPEALDIMQYLNKSLEERFHPELKEEEKKEGEVEDKMPPGATVFHA